VVNTDVRTGKCLHWIILYITKDRDNCVYFDSFGRGPRMRREFIKFVNRPVKKGDYNTRQIQDTMSTACDQYCVDVIHELSGGEIIKDILKKVRDKHETERKACEPLV
jgi:hypothetical protein